MLFSWNKKNENMKKHTFSIKNRSLGYVKMIFNLFVFMNILRNTSPPKSPSPGRRRGLRKDQNYFCVTYEVR